MLVLKCIVSDEYIYFLPPDVFVTMDFYSTLVLPFCLASDKVTFYYDFFATSNNKIVTHPIAKQTGFLASVCQVLNMDHNLLL